MAFSKAGQYDGVILSNPDGVLKLSGPAVVLGAHRPLIIVGENVGVAAFDQNRFDRKHHALLHHLVRPVAVVQYLWVLVQISAHPVATKLSHHAHLIFFGDRLDNVSNA